jgi:hypothetical protein
MNTMNTIINGGLKAAMGALHRLAELGCTVTRVELAGRNPVIWIEGGAAADALAGARKTVVTTGTTRQVTMAAELLGCQVQWRESYHVPGRAA